MQHRIETVTAAGNSPRVHLNIEQLIAVLSLIIDTAILVVLLVKG